MTHEQWLKYQLGQHKHQLKRAKIEKNKPRIKQLNKHIRRGELELSSYLTKRAIKKREEQHD